MKTVYSDKHKLRDAKMEIHGGKIVAPFECPRRAEIILERVTSIDLGDVIAPTDYGMDPVLAVHDAGFVQFLETCAADWAAAGYEGEAIANCWPTRTMSSPHIPREIEGKIGHYALASETTITEGTWEAALASKDVALTATDLVLNSGERAAFGLCRPPGHHAAIDQFGGYCFLNNAAIAAQQMLNEGASRVAILDVDFHHGNGTQGIFYNRSDVLTISIHADPHNFYPFFWGHANETGDNDGQGYNLNLPLAIGSGDDAFINAITEARKRIEAFDPGVLLVALGLDASESDPLRGLSVTTDGFGRIGEAIADLGLPTVFVQEGGYLSDVLSDNLAAVLGHAVKHT